MKRIGLKAGIGGALGITGLALCCALPTLGIAAATGIGFGMGVLTESLLVGIAIVVIGLVAVIAVKRWRTYRSQGARESEVAIACDPTVFSKEERTNHARLAENVLLRWPYQREEFEDGYRFYYHSADVSLPAIALWIEGEHRCCPWGDFALELSSIPKDSPTDLTLRWKGGTRGKAFLKDALHELEEHGEKGFDGFLEHQGRLSPTPRETRNDCGC